MASDSDSSYMDPLCKNLMDDFNDHTGRDSAVDLDSTSTTNETRCQRERMRVYLRIRPFTAEEKQHHEDQGCLEIVDNQAVFLTAPKDSFTFKSNIRGIAEQSHKFSFSNVYAEDTSQKFFFDDSMLGYVKDFINGQNCLVFTYGVTNAGKTFTIQGTPKDGGILPRGLDVIFNSIRQKLYVKTDLKPNMYNDVVKLSRDQQQYEETLKSVILSAGEKENVDLSALLKLNSAYQKGNYSMSDTSVMKSMENLSYESEPSIAEEIKNRLSDETVVDVEMQGPIKFSMWVSFAEIYNEYVYDLLEATPTGKGKRRATLKLGDDKNGNPYIKGLKEIKVDSADEAFKVLRVGLKNQNVAATKLNQHSSRSHSIFTIKAVRVVDVEQPNVARVSRLQFVDLAGSERHCKTSSKGDRLREAANINTSIMTLGKCIENLRYNQLHVNHPTIIPFRESKLTRLFQGFFLGRGKACMIVNINQCASYFDETFHVLKFSAVAKQVKTKAPRPTEIWKVPDLPKLCLTPAPSNKGRFATPYSVKGTPAVFSTPDIHSIQDEGLRKIVENLRTKLIEEKKKTYNMERKIREEVCQEMSEQIVDIENSYRERLEVEQQCMEELCDRRIEMLTKSLKKARKKRKLDQDEQEDFVPGALLQSERMKLKERDETIRKLQQRLSELQRKVDFMEVTKTPEHHSKAIEKLQNQLEEAKETLTVQEKHIEELETTVCDEREEKELALEKLNEVVENEEEAKTTENNLIEELRQLLESTTKELNEARMKLDDRDTIIKRLRMEIDSKQECTIDSDLSQKEIIHLKKQLDLLRQRTNFRTEEMMDMMKEKKTSENSLKDTVAQLKERNEELLFEKDELDIKVTRYEEIITNHKTALAESEMLIEQLNNRVAQKEKENKVLQNPGDASELAVTALNLKEELLTKESQIMVLEGNLAAQKEECNTMEENYNKAKEENELLKEKERVNVTNMEHESYSSDLINKLQQEVDRLVDENKRLNEERQGMQDIENMKQVLSDVEDKMKDYKEKGDMVISLTKEIENLKGDVKCRQEITETLSHQLEQERGNSIASKERLAEFNNQSRKLIEVEDEVSRLLRENHFINLKLADKENEASLSFQEIGRLQSELETLRANQEKNQFEEGKILQHEELIRSLKDEMSQLQTDYETSVRVKDENLLSAIANMDLARNEVESLKLEVKKLEGLLEKKTSREAIMSCKTVGKGPKEKPLTPGKSPSSPSDRLHFSHIRRLEKNLEEANRKLEEKDNCVAEKNKRLDKLRHEITELQQMETNFEILKKDHENANEKLAVSLKKETALSECLQEKDKCIQELQEINDSQKYQVKTQQSTISTLRMNASKLEEELTVRKEQLARKEKEFVDLETKASECHTEIATLKGKYEDEVESNRKMEGQVSQLSVATEKLVKEKTEIANELTSTKESLFQTRESYRKLEDDLIRLKRDIDTKSTDLKIKEDRLKRLTEQERKFVREIQTLTEQLHERSILVSEISGKQCDCEDAQKINLDSLQETVKRLQVECARKAEKLELRERTICNQKEKYMQLEQKLHVKDALLEREQKNQDLVFEQQKQITEYEKLIDDHAKLMNAQMDELSLLKNQIKDLEKIIMTLEAKTVSLKREIQEKATANEKLKGEAENLKKDIKVLQDERQWVEDIDDVATSVTNDNRSLSPEKVKEVTRTNDSAVKRRSSEIPLSALKEYMSSEKKRKSSVKSTGKSGSKSGPNTRRKTKLADENNENQVQKKSKRVLFQVDVKDSPSPNVILNTPEECKENMTQASTGPRRRRKLGKKSVTEFNMSPSTHSPTQRTNTNQTTTLIQRQLRSRNK